MLFILLSLPNDMIFDIKFNEQRQRSQDLQSNDCVFEEEELRSLKELTNRLFKVWFENSMNAGNFKNN